MAEDHLLAAGEEAEHSPLMGAAEGTIVMDTTMMRDSTKVVLAGR